MSVRKTLSYYDCRICSTSLTDGSYKRHMVLHSRKNDCSVCKRPFSTEKARSNHFNTSHKDTILKCDSCDIIYNHVTDMDVHKKFHSEECPYLCLICLRSYSSLVNLSDHFTRHQKELMKMVNTNEAYEYDSNDDRETRIKSVGFQFGVAKPHSKLLPQGYICEVCNKAFKKQDSLTKHMFTHEEHTIYKCNCCDRVFKSRAAIVEHFKPNKLYLKKRREENKKRKKSLVCEICGKLFNDAHLFKMHRESHLPPGHHPCHLCKKVFTHKWSLRSHLYRHKMNEFQMDPDGKVITFDCNVCNKKFSSTKARNAHRLIHTEIHMCSFCGKTFNKRWNLKTHVAIHLGDKRYSCSFCGVKYADRSNLTKHLNRHPSKFGATIVVRRRF